MSLFESEIVGAIAGTMIAILLFLTIRIRREARIELPLRNLYDHPLNWGDVVLDKGGKAYPCLVKDCSWGPGAYSVTGMLVHLNDDHECDWLSIADMLESAGINVEIGGIKSEQ